MPMRKNVRPKLQQATASSDMPAPAGEAPVDPSTLPPPGLYSVPSALIQGIANYLGTRPYSEVAHFVDALKAVCGPQNGK